MTTGHREWKGAHTKVHSQGSRESTRLPSTRLSLWPWHQTLLPSTRPCSPLSPASLFSRLPSLFLALVGTLWMGLCDEWQILQPIIPRHLFVSSPPLPWADASVTDSSLWVELYRLWTAYCQQVCKQVPVCIQWVILESGENPGHEISIFPIGAYVPWHYFIFCYHN